MEKQLGVLIVHGIGTQKRDYSDALQKPVDQLIDDAGLIADQVTFQEVLYAKVFDDPAIKRSGYLINTSACWQWISRTIRSLLIFIFGDAISYRAQYKAVHEIISNDIKALQKTLPSGAPIIIVAHSMGAMAISDYLYDLQENKYPELKLTKFTNLKAFITMGCNIPLFQMGHKTTLCIKRPESDNRDQDFFWLNFYSPFDVLGYRMAKYYDIRPKQQFVLEDSKIYAGNLLTKWNVFSHRGYWSHGKVQKCLANTIIRLLKS